MKSIRILMLSLIALFMGCTDLKEDTTGLVAPENFYTTVEEVDAGVAAVYRIYMEYYLNAQGGLPTLGGDDVTAREDLNKNPYAEFDQFRTTEANGWLLEHNWDRLYQAIYHANAVVNNYLNTPESQARDQAAAQAFFLRGWAYFQLVRTFGPIPIYRNITPDEGPRAPESEVYELIVSDMQFAVDNLPESWGDQPGRVTKWAAQLYLAKVHLTMAGWPLKATENYAIAANLAKGVVDNSGHELMPVFNDLWLIANNNNIESMLAVQACTDCGDWALTNRMPLSIGPSDADGGTGWDDYFAEIAFFEEFPEGPRKEATFRTTIETPNGPIDWTETFPGNPYYLKTTGNTPSVGFQTDFNTYVLRYAEALLTYAEAQNKADGSPNADAYEALNKVRRRAAGLDVNTPDPTVDLSGLSSDDFHQAVLDEAGWELAGEWHRWFNLVRNQIVAEATSKRKTDGTELGLDGVTVGDPESAFEKFYYAPIPANEMILRPDWQQNPCCN
ncbi:MAG: RagB/SusD family nutrient uptake outer membrane protein [Bacteroidota bacterium]